MKKKFFMIFLSLTMIMSLVLLMPNILPPAHSADVIKLKFANFFPPPARQSKICEEFISDVEKRTNGRVKIQYFAGGSLLKAPTIYNGVETGIADIGYAHVFYTPGRMAVTEAAGTPLGYPSAWVATHVVNDFYNQFKPKEWDKVKVLWFNGAAPSVVISKKPVRKLEDLKGLTIRAPGVAGDIVKALGGTPAPTPMMEVYDAIAKGVNDGVYTPYETIKTFRFAEVVDYTTISWQVGNTYPFYVVMNKNSWSKLPADIKEIFNELSGVYQERYALMWNEIDMVGKAFGAKKGVQYFELSSAEVSKWQKAVEPVIDNYVKRMSGKGYSESEVRGWIKFLQERIAYWTAKQIQYKIPSVTGPPEMRP
ncbi:MAG: TRAP transporter substrate-binding protein [Nitrospinaceae bacterium]|jgi:TRAP-type C4-dicarboxylate transport system substrate-binding protein|nr:TRAP transporter substrate-binding protein [Nitrospinaceae bacterium]|tara:strand:+ start:139 stop:1236 length:1098 start_codon:yes stop_codon:yes gene_type:complete